MTEESRSLEAGKYTLVARFRNGAWRGALWSGGRVQKAIVGTSIEDAWEQLTALLYEEQQHVARARKGIELSLKDACQAFLQIERRLPPSYKQMLRAHLRSPEQRITAEQLAHAAGYVSYSGANLHYGLLGAMLFAEMPEILPKDEITGRPVMTFAIANGSREASQGQAQWVWTMRPHIAEGLKSSQIL